MKRSKSNISKEIPVIKVHGVIKNPDGSCSIDYEVDDVFIKLVKREYNKSKVTKRDINKYFLNLLETGLDSYEDKQPRIRRGKKNNISSSRNG